jgi:large subunit ribosomal protein L32e
MFRLPKFKRQNSKAKKRLRTGWRRPTGIDNKLRERKKGFGYMPVIGYGSERKKRNTRNGMKIEVAHNLKEMEGFKGKAVFIGGTVGKKKRIILIKKAGELGIKVLNE